MPRCRCTQVVDMPEGGSWSRCTVVVVVVVDLCHGSNMPERRTTRTEDTRLPRVVESMRLQLVC